MHHCITKYEENGARRDASLTEHFYTTQKAIIKDEIIKNLLSAHKRIADSGNAKEIISITRYLLSLANKLDNKIIYIGAECNEYRGENPVNHLE